MLAQDFDVGLRYLCCHRHFAEVAAISSVSLEPCTDDNRPDTMAHAISVAILCVSSAVGLLFYSISACKSGCWPNLEPARYAHRQLMGGLMVAVLSIPAPMLLGGTIDVPSLEVVALVVAVPFALEFALFRNTFVKLLSVTGALDSPKAQTMRRQLYIACGRALTVAAMRCLCRVDQV